MKFGKIIAAGVLAASLAMPAASFAADKPVVGLVMKSLANEFFKNMLEGAKAHEAKRGDYKLKAVGMQSETDIETQINAVESFITEKVNAIVIAPADSRALVPPLKRAMEAGITVVNFDVALDEKAKKEAGVELAFVDQGYTGAKPALAAAEHGITLDVVKLSEAKRGFVLLPRRWVVERSFAWATRFRRLVKDYERCAQTLADLHIVAFVSIMLKNVAQLHGSP